VQSSSCDQPNYLLHVHVAARNENIRINGSCQVISSHTVIRTCTWSRVPVQPLYIWR